MIQARALIAVLLLIVLGATTALFLHERELEAPPSNEPVTHTASTTPPLPESKPSIPIPELIGQHFMIGHWANTPVASTTELIKKYHLGGVVIMSAPEDQEEIKAWTDSWQAASEHPLFIAIDQEGGPVSRLRGPDFIQTSQPNITSTTSAYEVGRLRGLELASLGINMNFAPVLDSAIQEDSFLFDRVFRDKEYSAELASSLIKGMAESAVIGVVKHFPGHPDTPEDSHTVLPTLMISKTELDDFTAPFRENIEKDQPQALMVGHLLFPEIDTQPVTLSSFFLTDYLRTELQYTGLIITDDMIMKAITASSTSAEASVQSLQAGADIILFAAEPTEVSAAVIATEQALSDHGLSTEKLQTSYDRILNIKQNLLSSTADSQLSSHLITDQE